MRLVLLTLALCLFSLATAADPPKPVWVVDLKTKTKSRCTVLGDKLFLGTDHGAFALKMKSGEVVWQTKSKWSMRDCSPAVFDSQTVIFTDEKSCMALDAATGSIKWRTTLAGRDNAGYVNSPIVRKGLVHTGVYLAGRFYALNGVSGAIRWNVSVGGYLFGEVPGLAEVRGMGLVLGGVGQFDAAQGAPSAVGVFARESSSSALLWSYLIEDPQGGVEFSPTVADGVVYFGDEAGTCYALNATNGHKIWSRGTSAYSVKGGPAAVSNGKVFFGTDGAGVLALDAHTGTPVWHHNTGGYVESAVVSHRGVVYAGDLEGGRKDGLYAFDAEKGTLMWLLEIDSGADDNDIRGGPTIANGVLYFATFNGHVFALPIE